MTLRRVDRISLVDVTHTFSGLPVADFPAAYDWYVRLLGRPADMFPHESECVWAVTPTSSIYVVQDGERAGSALVTLALDDLNVHERRLHEAGFTFIEEAGGAAPRRLVVSDLDGNRLAFFQDPSASGG
jgi:catechol 2,3-dioxygenase-like lactoylglutathione lyase family enzyme